MIAGRATRTVGGWVERSVPVLVGFGVAILAARLLPAHADDPLRVVLVWLPLVVGALVALERTPGARPLSQRTRQIDLLALAVLTVLSLARGDLGLRYSDPLVSGSLVAGFAALLGFRVLRQILALRPLLGGRLTARPPWIFFWLFFVVYLAMLPWSHQQRPPDGDEPYYLLLAHSLAYDLDVDLTNDYAQQTYRAFVDRPLEPQPGDPVGSQGQVYSRHNALLAVVLAPAYRLAGPLGALATMCALAALLVWSTLRLARHYEPERPGEALAACSLLALAPPLLLYSHQAWAEVPAALLLVLGLDAVLALDGRARPSWRAWAHLAIPLLLLPMLKLRFLALAASLVLLVLWRTPTRRRRSILLLAGGLALFVAGLLLVNLALYGSPLKYYDLSVLAIYLNAPSSYLRGLAGLFFDCAFGLFFAAPLWALVLPAIVRACQRRRDLAGHVAVLCGPYLLALAPRGEWFGAWSPPFRYGVALLPMLALLLIPLLVGRRGRGARWVIATLILATLSAAVVAVAAPGWTYNLADGRSHLIDRLSDLLGHDLARLVPSYLRPRLATWIWPPALTLGLLLLWRLPGRPGRASWTVAASTLILGGSAALAAAACWPTHVVELEDPWLDHRGGQLHPDRWRVGRVRFRGAWVFERDTVVSVPITPGGEVLRLSALARSPDPDRPSRSLRFAVGPLEVGRLAPIVEDTWRRLEIGTIAWPPGASSLQITAVDVSEPNVGPALLDRLDLSWSDGVVSD